MEYNFREIEEKWNKQWQEKEIYKTSNSSNKPKYYVLDMFPYPSGSGLHVGHPLGYIASDIFARFKRLKGFNVLHPMGYDEFGLPAEQYAIETGQHPAVTTKKNTARYREQLDKIGFSFDWSREVRTSDPHFYKWTQWIFLKLFKSWYNTKTKKAESIDALIAAFEKDGFAGNEDTKAFTKEQWKSFSEKEKSDVLMHFRIAYLSEAWVNWCPKLGTVLANDEVKDGLSERGGYPVERKLMPQWSLRMTDYAERMLNDLDTLDWPENIKDAQRNWIGRSEGSSLQFAIDNPDSYRDKSTITVFTTRPDTMFGVTFITLAPENELVKQIATPDQKAKVEAYINSVKNKSERERQAEVKKVTGEFTGAYAIHPFSGKKIPIWIGDYVLASYGTGAVMGVPAHDSRDHAFAKYFGLPIPQVIEAPAEWDFNKESYDGKEGKCINSDFLNGLELKDAIKKAIKEIEKKGIGKGKVNYRLRDAAFGRQRYWGEPIPIFYKDGIPRAMNDNELPLILPEIDNFKPTETGDPPLARAKDWKYQGQYDYEYTTMPGWAGSSWYYLRYMDPHNDKEFASQEAIKYWQNVDFYIGGAEHVTGHLLYVRFWTKVLFDFGYIPFNEPAQKLINQGMIQGRSSFAYYQKNGNSFTFISADKIDEYSSNLLQARVDISLVDDDILNIEGFKKWREEYAKAKFVLDEKFICTSEVEKMSKSKYNVVNPDDVINQFGADTLRMYEMFLGPLELSKPWSTKGISGVHGFLKKLWRNFINEAGESILSGGEPTPAELKVLHKTIKKVNEDIERLSLNTSVSAFMICLNELSDLKSNKRAIFEPLLVCLSPFAPYIAEELWSKLGHKDSIMNASFPIYNEAYLQESTFSYPVSFNGKTRFNIELPVTLTKEEVEKEVLASDDAKKWIQGSPIKKVIVVPKKIVNVVI
jgi:leucyl-tRNA synthetase